MQILKINSLWIMSVIILHNYKLKANEESTYSTSAEYPGAVFFFFFFFFCFFPFFPTGAFSGSSPSLEYLIKQALRLDSPIILI